MKSPLLSVLAMGLAGPFCSAVAADYTLHEWGTFTTVMGSDGTHLAGVHLEDAPLPDFVYELDDTLPPPARFALPTQRFTKGRAIVQGHKERQIVGVNVRLETPVLYFYTDEAFDAQVDVGFKGGSIGQWFPQRSAGEKAAPAGRLDFKQPRNGSIRWNVRVEPPGPDAAARVFRAGELPCWLYPRYPDSALVTNKEGETEKYLFYRGLGRMELPVVFKVDEYDVLNARNITDHPLPHWLVFDLNEKREARWWVPKFGLDPGEYRGMKLRQYPYRPDWRKALYTDGQKMLMDAGLNREEADAMMQTWWSSYFEAPGLRVFWIVPRPVVDEVLPLAVTPAPKKTERVIVGRSEILRPSFEARLVKDFAAAGDNKDANPWRSDRFFPAYASRVRQLNNVVPIKGRLPAGKWQVSFENGVRQHTVIDPSGHAFVTQAPRTSPGRASLKDGYVEVLYDDDRVERWMVVDEVLTVHHWHPASAMPDKPPVVGTAKLLGGRGLPTITWNDHISSARLGAHVKVLAYEDAHFGGRHVVLHGSAAKAPWKGSYSLFLNLSDALSDSETWNDRVSSIKVVSTKDDRDAEASVEEAVFFQNSHFEGHSIRLRVGEEIADLTSRILSQGISAR